MTELEQAVIASAIGDIDTDEQGKVRRSYLFTDRFPGFSGHFPGHPILPAIVQVLTVVSLAGEHEGKRLRLEGVEDAKFLIPIEPDREILVEYRIRQVGGRPLYDAALTVAGKKAASFLIELKPHEETP